MYRHYKGGFYSFLTAAEDADTGEQKAVFRNVRTRAVWIRPLHEFNGTVEVNGKQVARFTWIGEL